MAVGVGISWGPFWWARSMDKRRVSTLEAIFHIMMLPIYIVLLPAWLLWIVIVFAWRTLRGRR